MSINRSACVSSPWTAGGLTVLASGGEFYGVLCQGSAAASTLTILDGTANNAVLTIGTTASVHLALSTPIAFDTSIVAAMTGTASYSILYANRRG